MLKLNPFVVESLLCSLIFFSPRCVVAAGPAEADASKFVRTTLTLSKLVNSKSGTAADLAITNVSGKTLSFVIDLNHQSDDDFFLATGQHLSHLGDVHNKGDKDDYLAALKPMVTFKLVPERPLPPVQSGMNREDRTVSPRLSLKPGESIKLHWDNFDPESLSSPYCQFPYNGSYTITATAPLHLDGGAYLNTTSNPTPFIVANVPKPRFLTVLDIDPNAKTATVDAGSAEGLSPNDEYVAELSGKAAVVMKQPHVACRLTITSTDQHRSRASLTLIGSDPRAFANPKPYLLSMKDKFVYPRR